MAIVLEICANSVHSAVAAEQGKADRVELCDNLADGGTTPSYGMILLTRERIDIQLYPIIRPRGGDFLYDDAEFQVMWKDIEWCKEAGCDGVVIGLLTASGNIDKRRTKMLVDLAWPLGVTFHRAFDRCRDPLDSLEDVIETGCERILTSGQCPTAVEGADLIAALVAKAGDRIAIMAGSGVRPHNIAELAKRTGCSEYHSTAAKNMESKMEFTNGLVKELGAAESAWQATDPEIVSMLRLQAEEALGKRTDG